MAESPPAVQWREWEREAFGAAEKEGKPILLSIVASWCRWCHLMEETAYRTPQVVTVINDQFVPIRVDSDRRPDINQRYNQGGWPTTAILTPGGEVIAGTTFVPAERSF